MAKNTRNGAKSREWQNVNRKAFLAMNRAAALETAYMALSGELIHAMREVEEKKMTADEAMVHLMMMWQQNDAMLHYQFKKIESVA
jgi:hypothetical protein